MYEDADEAECSIDLIIPLLIPNGQDFPPLKRNIWNKAKRTYKYLSETLPTSGTPKDNADLLVRDSHFLKGLFNRQKMNTTNWSNIQGYYKNTARDLHPDKINHACVPARAKYVCAKVLSALRYFTELYCKVHRGGGDPG